MKELLQQVLDTPGCERLRDFAAVGPAQRAALELFVDWLRAAEREPMSEEEWWEVTSKASRELMQLSKEWADNQLHVYQHGSRATAIVKQAIIDARAIEATQYIALCDAMGYNERTDSLTSPEEHAQSLVAEIKRLKHDPVAHSGWELREVLFDNGEPIGHREPKHSPAPMTEEEILVRFDEIVNARAHDSKVILFARLIEARKARPMTDEEMILRGWRRCAVGQRTTQYCGQVEKAVAAERERVTFEMVNEAQRAVQEAVAAEREACAMVCEEVIRDLYIVDGDASEEVLRCAKAIRARGEK